MTDDKEQKYIEGIGRRKTAIARVRITKSTKNSILVNGKSINEYFKTESQRKIVEAALKDLDLNDKFSITVKTKGSGLVAQAEALRHGLSRALVEYNEELRKDLKKMGYLKRDPRSKERKKFGKKGARKSPQWSKR